MRSYEDWGRGQSWSFSSDLWLIEDSLELKGAAKARILMPNSGARKAELRRFPGAAPNLTVLIWRLIPPRFTLWNQISHPQIDRFLGLGCEAYFRVVPRISFEMPTPETVILSPRLSHIHFILSLSLPVVCFSSQHNSIEI